MRHEGKAKYTEKNGGYNGKLTDGGGEREQYVNWIKDRRGKWRKICKNGGK